MKKEEKRYAFTDCMTEDGGLLHLKELILRGYCLLPLVGDGIIILKDMKGGEENVFMGNEKTAR